MPDAPGAGDPGTPDPGDQPPQPLLPPPPPARLPPPPPPAAPPPPPGYYGSPAGPTRWPQVPGVPGFGPPVSPFANYGARLGAWLIDWVITSIIGAIVLLPLHAVHQNGDANVATSKSTPVFGVTVTTQGVLLSILIVAIYATALIGSSRGQTIGMMAMRAKAVDAESGGPIGHARALGRALFEYLMVVLLFAPWVLDMLFPLWDARCQTLHDKITNTVVIKA